MPEYCTCGTQLVEGSRFCHKCGRPTSGEPEPPVEVPRLILTAPVKPAVADIGVSFANPVVLRIAFAAATLSILLDFTPFVGFLFILWSMGAGFMAVWMYCKRTGRPLSVSSGAKMGWITGVFTFVILTVLLTAVAVLSGGKWSEEFHQQMTQQITTTWSHDPHYQDALRTLENPATFATVIFFMMFVFFALLSLASVAGGALGARFSNKE
jgi:hypothetical protein